MIARPAWVQRPGDLWVLVVTQVLRLASLGAFVAACVLHWNPSLRGAAFPVCAGSLALLWARSWLVEWYVVKGLFELQRDLGRRQAPIREGRHGAV
jgi:hypothetical protein